MGSSRSWAADHEYEIVTCRHGVESRYFDYCQCDGCKADRAQSAKIRSMADRVRYAALTYLEKSPENLLESRYDMLMSIMGEKT